MSSWEDFKKDAIKLKDRFLQKAKQLKDIGKIKLQIYNIEGDKEKCFKFIGSRVYEYYKLKRRRSVMADSIIKDNLLRLDKLIEKIKELNVELEKVKKSNIKADNI